MNCAKMTNPQYSFAFSKKLIETLAKHFEEVQRDEQSGWKRIALELNDFDGVPLQSWQELRAYFKRSLVFKLSKTRFTDDQELIDRLQYPYLRKVYSITVSFVDKAPNEKENAEDNVLFTKSVLDGTYDPAVVAVYKRYACKGRRVFVYINVNDPRYKLRADQRELLMQIEQRRARKHKPVRQLEAGVWHDAASGSRVGGTEGDPVVIEQVASPVQKANGSVRRLLDDESLDINTQEYEQMMKDSLEPQLPSLPKRRRFTIDSTVDSEEEQDELEATSVIDLTSSDSECQNSIVFVDPNDQFANSLINATHDPLQMSNAQLEANSQESQEGGEKDTVTSEPLFTPSSGESAKNNSEHPVEPEQTVSQEPARKAEVQNVSSDAVPVVQSSSSAKTLMADIAAITNQHEVPLQLPNKAPIDEERSTAPASSEIIRAEDLVAKSQPPTLILKEEPSPAGESRPPVTVKEESLDDPPARSAKKVGNNPAVPSGSGSGELAVPSTNTGCVARTADASNAKSTTGTIPTEQRTITAEQVSTKTVEEKRPTVVEVASPPIKNAEDLFNRLSGTVTDGPGGDSAAVQSEEPPVPSSNAENELHAPSVEIVQTQPEIAGTAKKVQPAVVKVEPPDSAKPKMTISASLLAVFDKLDAMFDGYHATITVSGTRSASSFDAVHVIQSSSAKMSQPDVARPVSEHTTTQQLHSKTPEKTSSVEQGSQVGSAKIVREEDLAAKSQPPSLIPQEEPSTADPDARPAQVGSVSASTDAENIVPPVVESAIAKQIQPGVVSPVNEQTEGNPAVQSSSDPENVPLHLHNEAPENASSVEQGSQVGSSKIVREEDLAEGSRPTADPSAQPAEILAVLNGSVSGSTDTEHEVPPAVEIVQPQQNETGKITGSTSEMVANAKQIQPGVVRPVNEHAEGPGGDPAVQSSSDRENVLQQLHKKTSKVIREEDRVAKSQPPNLIPQGEPSPAEGSRPTADVASLPTKSPPNRSSTEFVHEVPPAGMAPTAEQIQPAVVKAEPSEAGFSSLLASIDKYLALYDDSDSDSPAPSVANSGTKSGPCSPDAGEIATFSAKDPQINSGPISTEQRATGQSDVVKPINVPSSSGRVDVPQQLHNKAPEKTSSIEIIREEDLVAKRQPPSLIPQEEPSTAEGSRPTADATLPPTEDPPARPAKVVKAEPSEKVKTTSSSSLSAAINKFIELYGDFDSDSDSDSPAPSVANSGTKGAPCCSDTVLVCNRPGGNPTVQRNTDRENVPQQLHNNAPEETSSIIREENLVAKSQPPTLIPQEEPSTAEGSRPTVDSTLPPTEDPPARPAEVVGPVVSPAIEIATAKQITPSVDASETATSSAKDPPINSESISTEQRATGQPDPVIGPGGNLAVQSSPGSENVIQTSVPQGNTVTSTSKATSVSEESLPNSSAQYRSQASTSGELVPGAFYWEEDDSVQDDSRDRSKSKPVRPTVPWIVFRRWLAPHQTLEPVIRRHLALVATLRHRWPQLFHRTTADVFSNVNSLNDAITATLFPVLKPTNAVRVLQMRAMVDPLVIRIAYGLTPQELELAQQAVNRSHRPVLVERKWNIVLESSASVEGGGGSPAPKRIKISEAGSNSYTVQSNSPVAICLSDSEDSPSVVLPVRKRRQQRVRTELYK
ncbi:mucin-17-like [Culex pipiens pallens]|uniref:mucin-17-like n=1 Tax=Culex pipiens pallens TaxID=42434 RepID=UPI0019547E34|nr:mucin-17-like [Culex pipiens pallens]